MSNAHQAPDRADGLSRDKHTHGVSESYVPESKIDEIVEELDRNGYARLENMFSVSDCVMAKKKIADIYEKQVEECGGEDYLIAINDQNVARALLVYDDFFLRFLKNKSILDILQRSFGDKYILNLQNAPINKAHDCHYGSSWHRDLSYQHFVPSRPVAINVLVYLDNSTEDNGSTVILPGSHKFEVFPSRNYEDKNQEQIVVNMGDAVIFDSLLFHRAGRNNTSKDRNLLVHMFTLPFVKQQVNYPRMLEGRYSDDEQLSYLLGYDSEVEDSVIAWRKRRTRRHEKANGTS